MLAARLYVGAVVVFAALPTRAALDATVGERQAIVTLAAHFVEFVLLGVLVTLAARRRRPRREATLLTVAVGVAVAVGTELLQWPLPWRSFEAGDLVADLAGLALGVALVSLRGAAARGGPGRRA